MIKKKKKLPAWIKAFTISIFLVFTCILSFLGYVYYSVSLDAATRIQRGVINNIIFSESPVYYDDKKTPIGVFFEKTHRKYINYNDIPKGFIKAIIASEDSNFFNHPGFDWKAIVRAFLANIRAGKVVQGGSTLTQQTAKNIFKRQRRSYMSKLRELFQAVLLEKNYTKEDILEMYVNQFFVTGFGRGLRIATQYFFNKDAEELDLVESAFIAGSVKGPNRYNPFTKKTDAEKTEAIHQAKIRKDYVLANMFKMKFISKEQYQRARERSVPFQEGKVTYRLNVILDYIRGQFESDFFKKILHDQGIDNIATSGIRIYTSINNEIQKGALKSIREHLPILNIKVSGYDLGSFQERYRKLAGTSLKKSDSGLPFLCRITHINRDTSNPFLIVSWDKGGGIIDSKGLGAVGDAWIKWKLGNWATFGKRHIPTFLKLLKEGDLIPVRRMGDEKIDDKIRLALTQIPELEGGIIVTGKGMIKAMVGGFSNRFFNRAVDAKKQLGSIFKPIVYTSALQLKWNTLDPLLNRRELFHFENTFYIPKPDHRPKSDKVSMIWAGVKSENIASVWLLYHLTDHLNMNQFRQVVELVGLGKKADETYREYVKRIRDKHGIIVNREALMEASFESAKKEIETDLIFHGYGSAIDNVLRLHYKIDNKKLSFDKSDQSPFLDFHRLRSLNFAMKRRLERVKGLMGQGLRTDMPGAFDHFSYIQKGGGLSKVIYTDPTTPKRFSDMQPLTLQWALSNPKSMAPGNIWIDGLLPSQVVDLLQQHIKDNYRKLLAHKRYDLEVLAGIKDFRTLVNLLYVNVLSKKIGIFTRLAPVLSFPLGANSISIIEAALAYQTIMTGRVYPLDNTLLPDMTPIITEIIDREGEIIYQYRPGPKRVLSKRVAGLVSEILRHVIINGTGKRAKNAVQVTMDTEDSGLKIPIPCFGKTGTANQFRNSSFAGFIPGPKENSGQLDTRNGYVIVSYVGFDDNRPMKGKHMAIYGASGALPLWIDTANAIVESPEYKKNLQTADLVFDVQSLIMQDNKGLWSAPVSSLTGLPVLDESKKIPGQYLQVLSDAEIKDDSLVLKRRFEPVLE